MNKRTYIKEFARYCVLSVLGMLGVSCYILADTFFIAKGLGTNGLTSLNLIIPIYSFIHGTGLMLGMGGAIKFSICKGGGNRRQTDVIFTNTVYLALFFGAFFALFGVLFSNPLARLLGANSDILEMTDTYLRWMFLFAPAFIMNNVLQYFVRNDNSPTLCTVAMLVGSFSNIVLDYIFIFPMKMGMFGAVFATGLSPIISIMIMSLHWLRKKNGFGVVKAKLHWGIIRQEFSLGFPSLVTQAATGITMIIFNILILNLEGNVGVAAYGVVANISLVVVAVYTGISQGVQPLVSDSYGRGDRKNIRLGLRCSMATMTIVSIVIYFIIFVFADPITSIFNSENNLKMQSLSVDGLKIYFSSVLFVGFNTIIAVFFTSTEKALPAHILSLLRGIVLIVPMVFLLAELWKMTGIWLSYPLTELAAAIFGYIVYRRNKKQYY